MKVFAAILVALLAVQTSTQSPLKDDSIKAIIIEVVDAILGVTDPILQDVKSLVADFEANEDGVTADVVAYLADAVAQLNSLLLQGIDELTDGATDDGKAVLACINAQEDATDAALAETIQLAGACVAEQYPNMVSVANTVLGDLQDLEDDIQGQVDTLEACDGSELTCIIAFVTTLIETIGKVGDKLPEDIGLITDAVGKVFDHLDECDLNPGIKANAQQIFNNAVICIKS